MTQSQKTQQNSVAKIIKERRSIKLFKKDPLPQGLLEELLNVAVWAPNHGVREPWRFIAFQGEGSKFLAESAFAFVKRAIADPEVAAKRKEYISNIPLTVIVVMPEDPRQREWDEDFAAASALVQNFQLAAWEQGVGTIWKTDPYINNPEFRTKIGVKPGEKIVAMIHAGYPETVPDSRPRTDASELLKIVDFYPENGVVE
ncbi:nitroreductase [Paenibacillus sp. FSL R5-0636]|uniref:nitroreductase family protein n=1 Tax=Paenibacillus TaxID=44249 RepID=UPI00068AA48A|nr:nitroreductase [Paenibacillus odorifer]OMC93945.1 nitroreductase [Paenibacillus odorifer]OMD03535.1 nitroreductase [Paenibacillus odorifer]